jgi:hypothetical protein
MAAVFSQLLLYLSFRVPKKSSSPSQIGANQEISAPETLEALDGVR